MKSIRLTVLIAVLLLWSVNGIAQQKKSTHVKRAKAQTTYIAEKMNLNEDKKSFLYDALLQKFKMNTSKINGKDLTQEEKKGVYQSTNKKFREILSKEFSQQEINRINKLQNEANKKRKEKKK